MAKKKSKARLSARKTAEEHKGGFELSCLEIPEGMPLFQLKAEGIKRIEVIPFTAGEGNPSADAGSLHFERTYFSHRSIGADQRAYVCPRKTAGSRCPICDARAKLSKDPNADEDLIKDLAPKERQVWIVFDHDAPDKGLQLWDISHHLFGKQLYAEIKAADSDDDYEYFADPEDGLTLKLGVSENSFGGRTFYEVKTVNFKARKKPLDPDLIENAPCLDDLIKVLPYDELKSIFLQQEDPDDEDEDDKPKKGKGNKPKKGKPVDDEDEDEDDDLGEDEDDEDEDEPAPKKKGGGKKSSGKKKEPVADDFGLKVKDKVEYDDMTCTITKISGDGTSLTLEDEDGDTVRAVSPADVTKIEPKKGKGKPKAQDDDEDDEDEDDDDLDLDDDEDEDEDEDEDDEDEDDEDEDEDDEDEDDEDDEDDDDEEDEPAPKKKGGKAKSKAGSKKK